MNDAVVFMNQGLLWPVILVGLLLCAVFIWKEWSQRKERRFWLKVIASFLAIFSLVMLVLKPSTPQQSVKGKGIVLTAGYSPAQLDSLQAIYKRIKTEEYVKGRTLSILKEADTLFLLGHGMEPFDLWQVRDKSVAFFGGEKLEGWTAISYKNEVSLGETFQVKAKYVNPQRGNWAILTDNGGNALDSVPFEEMEEQAVTLMGNPKASGQFVYRLLEKDSEGTIISEEPVPIMIVESEPLKILMVNTFPTFETKYLKNFLTEKGHEVLARTQLTKGKYKFEYFNGASNPIYSFTEENLKGYDLLVIDTDSYTALGRRSKEAMEEAMKTHSLGVFIQPGESLFRLSERQSPFQFNRDFDTEIIIEESSQTLQKYPFEFKNDVRTQRIMIDSVLVAAYVPIEKGKIGTTVLQNTYQWILDGSESLYANIWTQILKSIIKEQEKVIAWKSITEIPRINEPYEFEVRTSMNGIEVTTDEGVKIPLIQNSLVPNKWRGVKYPRKSGWNSIEVSNDTVSKFSYFVFDKNQRKSIALSEKLKANYREFGDQKGFNSVTSSSHKELEPISSIWFYTVLLLCLGWLWLEPKLGN